MTIDERARRADEELHRELSAGTVGPPPISVVLKRHRRRRRRHGGGLLAGAVVVAALLVVQPWENDHNAELVTVSSSTTTSALRAELLLSCGELTFPATALQGTPADAEQANDPAAAALRELIARPDGIEPIPAAGYHVLVRTEDVAFFASGEAPNLVTVTLRNEGERWSYVSSGECRPRVAKSGLGSADWALPPDMELTPQTTRLPVLVTEVACTGGTSAADRLEPAEVSYDEDAITVTFFVRPLEPSNGLRRCQGNPPTQTEVLLDEPLADRALRDGSTYPPRPVADSPGPSDPRAPGLIVQGAEGEVKAQTGSSCWQAPGPRPGEATGACVHAVGFGPDTPTLRVRSGEQLVLRFDGSTTPRTIEGTVDSGTQALQIESGEPAHLRVQLPAGVHDLIIRGRFRQGDASWYVRLSVT